MDECLILSHWNLAGILHACYPPSYLIKKNNFCYKAFLQYLKCFPFTKGNFYLIDKMYILNHDSIFWAIYVTLKYLLKYKDVSAPFS